MKQFIQVGTTSKRLVIFAQDVTSTSGSGLTGLTHSSSGLTWYWYSETSGTSSAVTLAGQTLGTWTSGGFVEIDSTHIPGFYEIGVPNTLLTGTTPTWITMQLAGATNLLPVNIEIELTGFNPANGTFTSTVVGTVTATVPTTTPANVIQWNSTNVATPNIGGVPKVDVVDWLGTAVTSNTAGIPITVTSGGGGSTNVNVVQWLGTAVTSNAGVPLVSITGTVTATVPTVTPSNVQQWLGTAVTSSAGVPVTTVTGTVTATVPTLTTNVNVGSWAGHAVVTPNINGIPVVDVTDWLGTAVTSNAGVPLVDVSAITGTVTATVVGGTISTVTNPVSISTGQLTVKRDTALAGFTFPMYNGTTGNLQTGLTVACMLSIDGGVLQSSTNGVTEIGNGIYKLNLAAADLNGTVIILVFTATAASATVISLITQA